MPQVPLIAPGRPLTRFEAQRALGLFAPHDIVMLLLGCASWIVMAVLACFGPAIETTAYVIWALINVAFAQFWLLVLVYRVLVWILDLNAEIGLMPDAAARIAVGFLQGKQPPAPAPVPPKV